MIQFLFFVLAKCYDSTGNGKLAVAEGSLELQRLEACNESQSLKLLVGVFKQHLHF